MKLGVISPYPEFTNLVREISIDMDVPLIVKEGALQRGLAAANLMIEKENVSAIIARGATADLLESKLKIPIIKITVNNFDLLKTFQTAKQISSEIVFIDHYENYSMYDIAFIEKLYSVNIVLKRYQDEQEIADIMQQLKQQGKQKVIVGTAHCMERTAKKLDLSCFVIKSTKEVMIEALHRAFETARLYEREKLRQNHLQTIISHAFDGVIATDIQGNISVFNNVASELLDVKSHELIGRELKKVHHPKLKKLYGDGSEVRKKISSFGNQRYVVNRIPLEGESIVITFQETNKVIEQDSQLRRNLHNRRFYAKYTFSDILYKSAEMEQVIELSRFYSKTDKSVLITGESGTGKELFAQSIHNESNRNKGPFVAINCAALPKDLLESELFGYEDGAFTGAKKGGKPGLFEMAHEGTLFLDEIGELPIDLQARLLRVLQEREVMRIGGEKIIPINVRIISATNKDLKASIKDNNFREDLYFRLNILRVIIPPLRERKDDIFVLVNHFLQKNGEVNYLYDEDFLMFIKSYDWPGNVRELENVIERMTTVGKVSNDMKKILLDHPIGILNQTEKSLQVKGSIELTLGTLEEMENQIIYHFQKSYQGNKQEMAEKLGLSRTTLWKKIKKLDIL
ncbi:hypothetical protein ABE41_006405 [Fictibacillus arsenicus]|uniref:Sigma-54-dependent Fis family transcriptional regulator n=1 Tax=Fictibacillus arsenicus TaxID=255247 RepID=A0A1B1Z2E2_9BACL|nr:sigma 54-interacting transcriptional regulator [Fictibacillus arsenicus]ANX11633.1 hypothetical protein ABE41_006405 [Fictibacillus arsenicus]